MAYELNPARYAAQLIARHPEALDEWANDLEHDAPVYYTMPDEYHHFAPFNRTVAAFLRAGRVPTCPNCYTPCLTDDAATAHCANQR